MASRRTLGVLAAASVAAFAVVTPGLVGAAESSADPLEIRSVSAIDGQLSVDVFVDDVEDTSATVVVDGEPVEVQASSLRDAGVSSTAMLVLDNSASVKNGTVQIAKESLDAILPGGALSTLGVQTIGGRSETQSRPTSNPTRVAASIAELNPVGESRMWDGVRDAADLLGKTGSAQRNLILMAGSVDEASTSTLAQAANDLRDTGTTVHAIAVSGSRANVDQLRDLVDRTGGTLQLGSDTELAEMFGTVAERIGNQVRLTGALPDSIDAEVSALTVEMNGTVVDASFRSGLVTTGATALAPLDTSSAGDGILDSTTVKYLAIILGGLSAGALVFAIGQLITKRRDGLDFALRHYDETFSATGVGNEEAQAQVKNALLDRAVEVTGDLAQRGGVLARVENLLARADLPIRPAEAILGYVGASILAVGGTIVVTGSPVMSLVIGISVLIAPTFIVDFLARRRKKAFQAQLPDMLQLLAGTLRAGYSIGQGFEAVSNEIDDPMGGELRRAVTETQLGRPLEDALNGVATRMDSEDFGWAVMGISIQREVGGNLAELLMTVADTMTERERLRRDVSALTAEGRMSAIILGLLPPGLGVAMYFMNTEYISKLFSGAGLFLLGSAIVMMVVGFVWMKKTIEIEV